MEKEIDVNIINAGDLIRIEDKLDKRTNDFEKIMYIYRSALKSLRTKFDILNEEFNSFCEYNPIDHISERVKSPESIIEKMNRKGLELTYKNLIEQINDIAGIRIVCSFEDDVYRIVEIIESFQDAEIIKVKDYIAKTYDKSVIAIN